MFLVPSVQVGKITPQKGTERGSWAGLHGRAGCGGFAVASDTRRTTPADPRRVPEGFVSPGCHVGPLHFRQRGRVAAVGAQPGVKVGFEVTDCAPAAKFDVRGCFCVIGAGAVVTAKAQKLDRYGQVGCCFLDRKSVV